VLRLVPRSRLLWLCSDTVLHLASRNGHTATAKALVAAGADVNCQNSAGYASGRGLRRLSAALSLRRAELVSVGLCDAGTCCMCRRTALHHASEKGHTETARALVESGADVHAKDKQPQGAIFFTGGGYGRPLHHGQTFGFVVGRFDGGTFSLYRCTALHLASGEGHTETVKALVVSGADVNARDNHFFTPLLRASQKGYAETVKVLVVARADVLVACFLGYVTSLWRATWQSEQADWPFAATAERRRCIPQRRRATRRR
jgi:hypothetical protein